MYSSFSKILEPGWFARRVHQHEKSDDFSGRIQVLSFNILSHGVATQ